MDQRMIHEYRQKQQLNDECDRFWEVVKYIQNYGKEVNDAVAQVILINSEKKEPLADDDWVGLIQTFKKIIKN